MVRETRSVAGLEFLQQKRIVLQGQQLVDDFVKPQTHIFVKLLVSEADGIRNPKQLRNSNSQ